MKTSDAVYNNETRFLEQKIDIYFSSTPVTITKDSYLITTSLIEEAHTDSGSSPFGGVTSNELTIELLNENGIFSPTNGDSPYYGKMVRGVRIDLFTRPVVEEGEEEYEWDPMGIFYVTEWAATVTGLLATITANDILYGLFTKDLTALPVLRDVTQKEFYEYIFINLGIELHIEDELDKLLSYAYINADVKSTLSKLNESTMSDCFCAHDGNVTILALDKQKEVRATITDGDQILEAKIEQALSSGYDGAEVVYNLPFESEIQSLLSIKDLTIPTGTYLMENQISTAKPILRVCYSSLKGVLAKVHNLKAAANSLNYQIVNEDATRDDCTLDIYGTTVVDNMIKYGDEGDNLLSINNIYIQEDSLVMSLYDKLTAYINNALPILELSIRGNPTFELGDVICAQSARYNLNYTGILIKQTFEYDGGLSSNIKLLNINILKEG